MPFGDGRFKKKWLIIGYTQACFGFGAGTLLTRHWWTSRCTDKVFTSSLQEPTSTTVIIVNKTHPDFPGWINFNASRRLPWACTEKLFFCCLPGTTLMSVGWNGIWCRDYRAQSPGGRRGVGVSGSWPTNTHPIVSNVQHKTGSEVMKVTHVSPAVSCSVICANGKKKVMVP